MARVRATIIAATLLAAAGCATGCATAPASTPMDGRIDFVRGCWVQKPAPGEEAQAFLRLLPEGDRLAGVVVHVSAGRWDPDAVLSFAKTGTRADFNLAANAPMQTNFGRIDASRLGASFEWARPHFRGEFAAFAEPAPSRRFLFAEATPDRLSIWSVSAARDATLIFQLFEGERDGCD